MLSRHGSRYPTVGSNVEAFGRRIDNATGKFEATDKLAFLNTWKYELGAEILVPRGRQELFESGILHYYNYGRLYNPNSKIIARTTTQVNIPDPRQRTGANNHLCGNTGVANIDAGSHAEKC